MKLVIVVFNFGGLDKLEVVWFFLCNLFCDLVIIQVFGLICEMLVWLILIMWVKLVCENYVKMGGGFFFLLEIQKQFDVLEVELWFCYVDFEVKIWLVMCYWYFFIEDMVRKIEVWQLDWVILLLFYL